MPQHLSASNRAELIKNVSALVATHSIQAVAHALVEVCHARALRQHYDTATAGVKRRDVWRNLAYRFTDLEELAERDEL